jgi:hypothetical protein
MCSRSRAVNRHQNLPGSRLRREADAAGEVSRGGLRSFDRYRERCQYRSCIRKKTTTIFLNNSTYTEPSLVKVMVAPAATSRN